MEYKIIHADKGAGQIQVLYTNDGAELGMFAIDVPIVDGAYISGDTLRDEILNRAPVWVSARSNEVKTAAGWEAVESMVQPLEAPAVSAEEIARRQMLEQMQFEKLLGPTLVKWGLLQSNPAEIQVTQL